MQNEWLVKRIQHIDGLKNPNEQQQLLTVLYKQPDRTKEQEKKLAMLVRAERATEKALQAKSQVVKMLNDEKKKAAADERKARNHRLILQGTLFDLAGLETRSRGELMGALLSLSKIDDTSRWASWKAQGDALLAEKEKSATGLPFKN